MHLCPHCDFPDQSGWKHHPDCPNEGLHYCDHRERLLEKDERCLHCEAEADQCEARDMEIAQEVPPNLDKPHRCPKCHAIPEVAHVDGYAIPGKWYWCMECGVRWKR